VVIKTIETLFKDFTRTKYSGRTSYFQQQQVPSCQSGLSMFPLLPDTLTHIIRDKKTEGRGQEAQIKLKNVLPKRV